MSLIKMPKLAGNLSDATVVRWNRKEGDAVEAGESVALLETEESLVELQSPSAGTLHRIICQAGRTAPVGAPIAVLKAPGENVAEETRKAEESFADFVGELAGGARKALTQLFGRGREAATAAAHAVEEAAGSSRRLLREVTSKAQAAREKKKDAQPMAQPSGPVHPILMPQAGNSMEEGTLLSWKVKPGDTITKGDVLAEIETDKATMEVEAEEEGRLARLVAAEGDIIPVKEPIAFIAESDADVDAWLAQHGGGGASSPVQADAPAAPAGVPAPPPEGAVSPVLMPQAGNSMEEGTLLSWKVKEGDTIAVGDVLAEIETDKATMEVEAEEAGTVALLVAGEGDIVPVKEPIALLAEKKGDAEAWLAHHKASTGGQAAAPAAAPAPKAPAPSKPAPKPPQKPASRPPVAPAPVSGGRVKASPAARKFARELGVDLAAVGSGRGPGGRLLSTDVEAAAKAGFAAGRRDLPTAAHAVAPAGPVYIESGEPVREPLSRMRRAIGKNLVASKQSVPHFYVKLKFDADPLMALYRREKAAYKVTINDVILLAVGRVIQEFPPLRSRIDGNDLEVHPHSNIGIAVGTDDGLIVPVVMYVEGRSLEDLATETRRVVEAGRTGKVEGQGHGVFTISNLGMFGVPEFSAIINPPESGILAVGTIVEEVIVKGGAMRPGRTMTLTLSADHRVVDGLVAGQFCARLKEVLEHPEVLL